MRGSLDAHASALAIRKLIGVELEKRLSTPNIDLSRIPACEKYLDEGKHRRLYTFSPDDYAKAVGVWSNDEVTLPGDPPGDLEVVDGASGSQETATWRSLAVAHDVPHRIRGL